MLTPLHFPKADLKLFKKEGQLFVWDIFRKKRLKLTPEEWVRQHALHYLVQECGVPQTLIAAEYGIRVNDMERRCDGVVFDRSGKPIAIIECKAPAVKLEESTLHQIAQYNFSLGVKWLILTNGLNTITAFINAQDKRIDYIKSIPTYEKMQAGEKYH
ncbi:MAG: type I restriction enzyme HsdR N-terminal domain-containing protein [Bacteroidota bacterium]